MTALFLSPNLIGPSQCQLAAADDEKELSPPSSRLTNGKNPPALSARKRLHAANPHSLSAQPEPELRHARKAAAANKNIEGQRGSLIKA